MCLISGILTLPFAPVRGTIWVAEQIRQQAEDELYDPARIREQIEAVDRARTAGDLTDEEATRLEDELVERLMVARTRPSREG